MEGGEHKSSNECSLSIYYSMLGPALWHFLFQLKNSCLFYIKKKESPCPKLYVKILQDAVQYCLWPWAPLGIPWEVTVTSAQP